MRFPGNLRSPFVRNFVFSFFQSWLIQRSFPCVCIQFFSKWEGISWISIFQENWPVMENSSNLMESLLHGPISTFLSICRTFLPSLISHVYISIDMNEYKVTNPSDKSSKQSQNPKEKSNRKGKKKRKKREET